MKWWLFPALGTALCAVYFLVPSGTLSEAVFAGVGVLSVAAIVVGIGANQPVSRTAWILIAAGTALWVSGDVAFLVISRDTDVVPTPSSADIAYLAGYPVLAVGLYLLVHQGWRRGELGHVANSTIVMIAYGLLMWVFVVHPESVDVGTAGGLIGIVYPAMDVFLLGMLVHFFGSTQWQSKAFRLLTAGVLAALVADTVSNITTLTEANTQQNITDAGYLAFYVLAGTAALHPSMHDLFPPDRRTRRSTLAASFNTPTVFAVTAAALTPPGVMAILLARGEPVAEWGWGLMWCATLLVCLVFVRVTELLGLLHRQNLTLRAVSETDHLTGLPNRLGLEVWVERHRSTTKPLTLLLLDVDRFKEINDTFGHSIGDEVLRVVGERVRRTVGNRGAVGRLGADEFGAALLVDTETAMTVVQELHASLLRRITVQRATLLVEASIGIAGVPGGAPESAEVLIRRADLAMQAAKSVQPRIAVYDTTMERDNRTQLLLLSELTAAIDTRQLEVYYQIQVELDTMEAVGVEALLRWNHPVKGLLEPDLFLPMAERTGLMRPLLDYVLTEALMQQQRWRLDGLSLAMSINISARNLLDTTIVEQVRRAVHTTGSSMESVTVEITETAAMRDPRVAIESLVELRSLGISLAIDDYGTGYSSLTYLQSLPVQQLKIDKTFVKDMTTALTHRIIVRSTIDLARTLGLSITAEGVEDLDTLLELKQLCCHYAQGYYLGRPAPARDIPESVAKLNAELREFAPRS